MGSRNGVFVPKDIPSPVFNTQTDMTIVDCSFIPAGWDWTVRIWCGTAGREDDEVERKRAITQTKTGEEGGTWRKRGETETSRFIFPGSDGVVEP